MLDLADVKPSLYTWLVVGLMAVLFISVAKYAMARYPIPGLAPLIMSI
jgi:ABC-type maltose transport system permease subunit